MKTTIVLIEDNKDLRETTTELLEISGYEVIAALDGLDGLNKVKQSNPDLILCDIMMPNLDGYGVLHILSQDPQLNTIPFIFLTAKSEPLDFRQGMELGADDYIIKPFKELDLLKSIETRLKKSRKNVLFQPSIDQIPQINEHKIALDFLNFELNDLSKRIIKLDRKGNLFSEGDSPQKLFYLKSGRVKIFQLDESGKQFITHFISPGDFFGYVDILEEQNYRENAEAMEDSIVLSISSEEFKDYIGKNHALEIHFRKLLTESLIQIEKNMISMAYNSLRIRTAKALVDLAENSGATINQPFSIRIMREDLANKMGTAPESVIRTLSEFKKEGLLEMKGSQILIFNLSKLIDLKY